MIDLTPLDVRNKRGDFKRLMRGYDPQEVDVFLELVAERLESLVRENIQLRERTMTLQQQVESQLGREQAVQDAIVTAQALRADIQAQTKREADHILKEADSEARRIIADAESQVRARVGGIEREIESAGDALAELERRRKRFLKDFRSLLLRELDVVEVEQERRPLEDRAIELELGVRRGEEPLAEAPEVAGVGQEEPASEPPSVAPAEGGVEAPLSVAADEAASVATASFEADAPAAPEPEAPPAPESEAPDVLPVPEVSVEPETTAELAAAAEAPGPDAEQEADANDVEQPHEGDEPTVPGGSPTLGPALRGTVPTELETPSFARRPGRSEAGPYDELAAAMEAEAVAQAGSEVVEVTGADGDPLGDVPRLEQLLAEAGAELMEVKAEADERAARTNRNTHDPRHPDR